MIYVLCSGGMGNQMFQYAYLEHLNASGKKAILDTSFFIHNDIHSGYALDRAFGINGENKKDHFNKLWRIKYAVMARMRIGHLGSVFMEQKHINIDEKRIGRNAVLYGFWQGEQFFADVKLNVKNKFLFSNISNEIVSYGKMMNSEASVAVHIRRGDYLNNPKYVMLTETMYYKNALEIAKNILPKQKLYIFSDDILWCKNNGMFENAKYIDFTHNAYEDMYLMSKAKGIIIANSTFSWWAGYLGEHLFVIRPEKYMVEWKKEQDIRLFPKEWKVGEF